MGYKNKTTLYPYVLILIVFMLISSSMHSKISFTIEQHTKEYFKIFTLGSNLYGKENNTTIVRYSGLPYLNHSIASLNGATLIYSKLSRFNRASLKNKIYDLYMKICGTYEISGKIEEYYNKDYDLYVWRIKGKNESLYISELIYINLTYGNGYVNELYLMNKSELNKTLFMLYYVMYQLRINWNFFDLHNISIDLVYAGIGADRVETTYITQYVVENDTLISKKVPIVRFINPYYKFYILFNGVRIGYPIQVGYEDRNGHKVLKYLRMFIPNIGFNNTHIVFTIDRGYLRKIANLFNNATGYNVSMNDIVVGDIYYYPTGDLRYFAPVLVLYANDTSLDKIVVMRLYPDTPKVESILSVLGHGYVAGDVLSIENYILSIIATGIRKTYEINPYEGEVVYVPIFEYLIVGALLVTLIVYLASKCKWLRRLYRESLKE